MSAWPPPLACPTISPRRRTTRSRAILWQLPGPSVLDSEIFGDEMRARRLALLQRRHRLEQAEVFSTASVGLLGDVVLRSGDAEHHAEQHTEQHAQRNQGQIREPFFLQLAHGNASSFSVREHHSHQAMCTLTGIAYRFTMSGGWPP